MSSLCLIITMALPSSYLPSVEGMVVGRGKKQWTVGRKLGEGACGVVHELLRGERKLAIKLAPCPSPTLKQTSKAYKAMKHNVNLLHFEQIVYTAQLPHLMGDMIPTVPSSNKDGLEVYGEIKDKGERGRERGREGEGFRTSRHSVPNDFVCVVIPKHP